MCVTVLVESFLPVAIWRTTVWPQQYWRWRQTKEKNNMIYVNNIRTMTDCRMKSNLFWPHDLIVFIYTRNNTNTIVTLHCWNDTIYHVMKRSVNITRPKELELSVKSLSWSSHTFTHSDHLSSYKLTIKAMKCDRLTEHMDGHCSQWFRWTKV